MVDGQNPPFEKVSGAYLDHRMKKFVIVTKDILVNQLKRDCPKIALSFDDATGTDLEEVSAMLAATFTILSPHIVGRDLSDEARGPTCARLLNTAMATFMGCIHLARGGFRLQYMTLSRSAVETICTVMHLMVEPLAIRSFHTGKLKSTRSISAANKVLPGFGKIWGELSNQFVHINTMHSDLNPVKDYHKGDDDLTVIRMNMRMTSWLLFVAAELVFVDVIDQPRYWRIFNRRVDGNEVVFDPSPEEIAWHVRYFDVEAVMIP